MTLAEIITNACHIFNIPKPDLIWGERSHEIVRARFAVYWAARNGTRLSYSRIARILRRDHSTIQHGVKRAAAMRESDPAFKVITDALIADRARTAA